MIINPTFIINADEKSNISVSLDSVSPTCTLKVVEDEVMFLSKSDNINILEFGLTKSSKEEYNNLTKIKISKGTFYGYVKDTAGNTGYYSIEVDDLVQKYTCSKDANGKEFEFEDKAQINNVFVEDVGWLVIVAKWEKIVKDYIIHFDSNGGTGTMNDQKASMDSKGKLNNNEFSKKDYRFIGWKAYIKDINGNTIELKDESGKEITFKNKEEFINLYGPNYEEVTLFAQWEIINPLTGLNNPVVWILAVTFISIVVRKLLKNKEIKLKN